MLWLGDSITQAGTYVSYLEFLLTKADPAFRTDLIAAGLASETTSGLSEAGHADGAFDRPCVHERLARALDVVKPDLVVACYGMNDGVFEPFDAERMAAFTAGVTRLVHMSREHGADVVLITPPVYEGDPAYAHVLDRYAAWEVATPPLGVTAVIDLHQAMSAELAARRRRDATFAFTVDTIHPDATGHAFMALALLRGSSAAQGLTAEELVAAANADPIWPLIDERRQLRTAAWLEHIGYSRERFVPPGSGDIASAEARAAALQAQVDALRA